VIKRSDELMSLNEIDDYAKQVATILVGGAVKTESAHYLSYLFEVAKKSEAEEVFSKCLYQHLSEALNHGVPGIEKVQEMSVFMMGLVAELAGYIAKAIEAQSGDGASMDTMQNYMDTRRIFNDAAQTMYSILRSATKGIIHTWKHAMEHKRFVAQIRKEVCGDRPPDEGDKTIY
jgi:hypothetical protein